MRSSPRPWMPAAARFGFGGGGCSAAGSVGGSVPGWGVSVLGPAVAVASAVLDNGRRPLRADTPHPVPCAPYAANGPSGRAIRRTARRGARYGERSVVVRGGGIGPSWCVGWGPARRGAWGVDRPVVAPVTATPQGRGELRDQPPPARTRPTTSVGARPVPTWRTKWGSVRCGAGGCNAPGARGTRDQPSPARTRPITRPGTFVGARRKLLWRTRWGWVRRGAGDCNSPGARGTARPAPTSPHRPAPARQSDPAPS
ncbi:hypothetical protein SCANM124S_05360 [Streptomyces canus]